MNAVITIAKKDLLLLWRDRFGLFWVLAFPLLMALFFGAIFGGGGGGAGVMKVVLVDRCGDSGSLRFFELLDSSSVLDVERKTYDEAMESVRRGKATAFIILEEGFGGISGFFEDTGSPGIRIGIDPSRKAEAGYLKGLLNQAYFSFMFEQFSNPGNMRKHLHGVPEQVENAADLTPDQREVLGGFLRSLDTFLADVDTTVYSDGLPGGGLAVEEIPVAREVTGPRTSFEITFPQAIAWGLIGCVAAFSISIVLERVSGTLSRLRFAPISRTQILAGKALGCFLACVSVTAFLLLIGRLLFGVRILSPPGLAGAVLSSAVCFTGIMMLVSVLGKTERAVGGAGWAIFLLMNMFGGAMVPLMAMPSWMKLGSNISPVKWSILAIEGAVWRGFSPAEMIFPCSILILIGITFFSAGAFLFSRFDP